MEKVFDRIDRNLLMFRLLQFNIDGKMYKAIQNLYWYTESCIRVNDMLSEWFPVCYGVRQGDNLSPTLFSLFANDLAIEIKNMNLGLKVGNRLVSILLYADDMVLISPREIDLQRMLNKMAEWCHKWRLKVNESKSKIVHFRSNRQKRTNFKFQYGPHFMDKVPDYKYLGIFLDEFMNLEKCSKTLADSGGRALGAVWSKFKLMKDVGIKTYTKMYDSGVVPILDYGSGVWSFLGKNKSQLIQNKAIRYFLGVHSFAALSAIQGDMGWLNCKFRQQLNVIRFWNRLIDMPDSRLTKHIFTIEYDSVKTRGSTVKNWFTHIRNTLDSIGLKHFFDNRTKCDMEDCKSRLLQLNSNEWTVEAMLKPKLRQYVNFKTEFTMEPYVSTVRNKYYRSLIAKLRCGILQLHVESGRFNQTPLQDRICQICNNGQIEDVIHFICTCTSYHDERKLFYNNLSNIDPTFMNMSVEEKFRCIMSHTGYQLAKFIHIIWNKRNNMLYT